MKTKKSFIFSFFNFFSDEDLSKKLSFRIVICGLCMSATVGWIEILFPSVEKNHSLYAALMTIFAGGVILMITAVVLKHFKR